MIVDAVKAAVLAFAAALVQVSFVNAFELSEGRADVVLLALVGIGLLRGPVFGACAGFFAGVVVDTATFGTLGLTSLLLTLTGYGIGRLGESTSHQRNQRARVLIAALLATLALELGSLVVHTLLGGSASFGQVVGRVLAPSLGLNLLLAIPAYAVLRRLFPPPARPEREVVAAA
ncbi:MAG: rod shape-determining protein MreD [Thermoleophilia bacterium]|nr:rod shape-determining protein MreD [Thermoleophilia bacterium]